MAPPVPLVAHSAEWRGLLHAPLLRRASRPRVALPAGTTTVAPRSGATATVPAGPVQVALAPTLHMPAERSPVPPAERCPPKRRSYAWKRCSCTKTVTQNVLYEPSVFLAILLEIRGNSFEFPRQNGDATTLPHASRVRVQCTAILGSADSEDRSIFAMETHNRVRWWSVSALVSSAQSPLVQTRRGVAQRGKQFG